MNWINFIVRNEIKKDKIKTALSELVGVKERFIYIQSHIGSFPVLDDETAIFCMASEVYGEFKMELEIYGLAPLEATRDRYIFKELDDVSALAKALNSDLLIDDPGTYDGLILVNRESEFKKVLIDEDLYFQEPRIIKIIDRDENPSNSLSDE